jgi:hypothetical protein
VKGRARIGWLLAGIAATVVAIAGTGSGLWYATAYKAHIYTQTETTRYREEPAELTVQLSSGTIMITSGPAGQVTVTRLLTWTDHRPVIDEHWDNRALDIQQDCPTGLLDQACSVSYQITVPPGVPLNLSSEDGDVTVTRSLSQNVHASSGSGDIWLDFATAPSTVVAQTDSGNVTVRVPPGGRYSVEPSTDSGNQQVNVSQDPAAPRNIIASSDDGNITVEYGP